MPENEAPETADDTSTAASLTDMGSDLQAELDKWKSLARKHEDRAKANSAAAKELEQLKVSMLTEQEKAIEQARAEARQATISEFAGKLVDAKLQAHLNGKTLKADAVLNFNKSVFLTDDGDVDESSMLAWIESNTTPNNQTPAYPELGQGVRNEPTALNSDPLLRDLKAKLGLS